MNAANMNDPAATTAAISPAARTNGSPYVVTGPGSGRPVAVSASASVNAARLAAVTPLSSATPTSTGHTARTLRADVTVMHPAYGWLLRCLAQGATLGLAGVELFAGELLDGVEITQDGAQLIAEGGSALVEVGGRLQQVLVG